MYNHLLYLAYWLINTCVIFILYVLFPSSVVINSGRLLDWEVAFYAGFWITFFVWSLWDFLLAHSVKVDHPWGRASLFYIINIIAVWVTSEFWRVTNFGPISLLWILVIALLGNWLQLLVWKLITKPGKTS